MIDFDPTIFRMMLAQEGGAVAPPPAGESSAPAGTLQSPDGGVPLEGTGAAGGKPSSSQFNGVIFMLPLVLIVIIMIFSSRGQKKERQKREAMLRNLSKHDRVQTVGGIIGSVVEVKDMEVVIRVDESTNTKMRFSRSAIQRVLTDNNPVDMASSCSGPSCCR